MKLITNKYGKAVNYNEILNKQQRYKRRKTRQQQADLRDDKRTMQLHRIRTKLFDSELNCSSNQIAMHARIQPDAQKLVDSAHESMSLYEVEKLVKQQAKVWESSTTQDNDQFFTATEQWGVTYREKADDIKRRDNWMANVIKKPQYSSFYVIANLPTIGIKFDTRKKLFTYDKVKRRTIKKPDMAVYDNYNATRWSVINKILMKIGYKIGDELNENQRRNDFLNTWLKDNGLELTSSFAYVPCVHIVHLDEYPALVFSLSRTKNSATTYTFNPDHGVSRRVDEQVVEIENDTLASKSSPLSYYELEDYVIKGALDGAVDATRDVVINSIEDAYCEDSKGARNKLIIDLPEGIAGYANAALGIERMDLVELATDYKEPECPMVPEIAETILNGDFDGEDAKILYGDIYHDNGVRKRGLYLRKALDVLINAGWLTDVEDEDEYYKMRLKALGLI